MSGFDSVAVGRRVLAIEAEALVALSDGLGEAFTQAVEILFACKGRIVLTVAHLDHQPENCSDSNLKAMCQRCHLRYDVKHHQANASATRRAKKQNGELFDSCSLA